MEEYLLFVTLAIFSIVQSLFGVGLLVFGTPTLLIFGYSFEHTLSIVLPASIVISILQIRDFNEEKPDKNNNVEKLFFKLCLPFIIVGLFLTLYLIGEFNLNIFIGAMLILSSLIRVFPNLSNRFDQKIIKYKKVFLILMGFIHGMTNMGGGLLTLYASATQGKEKEGFRATVAYGYLLMAGTQYLILIFNNHKILSVNVIFYCLTAFISYLILGKVLFKKFTQNLFHYLTTVLMATYGILLIIN